MAFDKGGLDALMGDEGADASAAGAKLLSEVARVVDPRTGGVPVCHPGPGTRAAWAPTAGTASLEMMF